MSLLFSEAGYARLDQIVRPGVLCAFDFDGTLAPLVAQPEHVRLPVEIKQHLIKLSEYAPVAIITGRSLEDIRHRLGFDPDFVVGNHGMQGMPGWEAHAERHQADCAGWRAQLELALLGAEYDSGIHLEDKRYSLSLHYRMAGNHSGTAKQLEHLFASLRPRPRIVSGKYVFNLVSQDACHKGDALEQLMLISGARHAVYVGDDVTDEDVFRLARRDVLSIRIEASSHSAAEFHVPHSQEIGRLLQELIARLKATGACNWLQVNAVSAV